MEPPILRPSLSEADLCIWGMAIAPWQGTNEKAQNVIHWVVNIKNAGSKRK